MNIDAFMAACGIGDVEGNDGLGAVTTECAEAFLRAGGSIALAEWASLNDMSRAALVDAGNRIATERAVMCGLASLGPDQAAKVMQSADGGATRIRLALERVVAKALDRIGRTNL